MAKRPTSTHLLDLAKRGAEVRARFLADELRLLFSAFPHLHDAFDADELPVPFILKLGAERSSSAPPSNRKPMSRAAGKRDAERTKRYAAARRATGDK